MNRRISLLTLALLLVGLSALSFTTGALAKPEKAKPAVTEDVYKYLNPFVDALALIQDRYVDEDKTKPKDLMYGAIDGMVSTLDPFSQFMTPDDYKEMQVETSGEFGGLGIEIGLKDTHLTVITPIEGTPAERAGLQAGDRIVKIGQEKTDGMAVTDAVKRLRGKKGTPVTITILREGLQETFEVTIVRDTIKIQSVRSYRLAGDIGYIRISEFIDKTTVDFKAAYEALKKEKPLRGLIVDLRNNPGGLLNEAFTVADLFVEKGKVVVSTKGRDRNQNQEYIASGSWKIAGIPIVTLVNEGSASGSEIVAGAVKDLKKSILVGEKTFGKGSVQTILPLENSGGAALRLTTAKYYTPSGICIHGIGIEPDVEIKNPEFTESTLKMFSKRSIDEFVKRLENEKMEVDSALELSPATMDRFYDFCVAKTPSLLKSDLKKDGEFVANALVLELIREKLGEKEARRVAVLRDKQVHVATDIIQNGGKIPAKYAGMKPKPKKDKKNSKVSAKPSPASEGPNLDVLEQEK